jgi:hypothetical protein
MGQRLPAQMSSFAGASPLGSPGQTASRLFVSGEARGDRERTLPAHDPPPASIPRPAPARRDRRRGGARPSLHMIYTKYVLDYGAFLLGVSAVPRVSKRTALSRLLPQVCALQSTDGGASPKQTMAGPASKTLAGGLRALPIVGSCRGARARSNFRMAESKIGMPAMQVHNKIDLPFDAGDAIL